MKNTMVMMGVGVVLALFTVRSVGADFQQRIRPEWVDVAQSRVWHNGVPGDLDAARMLYAFGLAQTVDQHWRAWSAGRVAGESAEGDVFQYQVAFTQPVVVGSVLTGAGSVARLRADAPYPGDPANPDHWEQAQPQDRALPRLATFDDAAATRALLFTDRRRQGVSSLGPVRVYAARFFNAAPLAGARARAEYVAPDTFGGQAHRAISVARGSGSWVSTGRDREGRINEPPVSDVHPQWYVLAWEEPRTLSGLYLQDNFADFVIETYEGPSGVTALAGVDADWRRLRDEQFRSATRQGRWIHFREGLTTRGIRLRVTRVSTERDAPSQVARIDRLLAFEALGEAPVPVVDLAPPPPPFGLTYQAPQEGYLTLVVDDENGQRVRNLFARRPREAGPHTQPWDLTAEDGSTIAPGRYRWRLVTGPELELHYETSVYPNVSVHHPENTAWLNGKSGPGGWLADHSSPRSVSTAGEYVFFGSPTPEHGVGFAASDLDGRKLWGIGSFAAWSGGTGMATDGETVFVEHMGSGHYGAGDAGADRVWAVDIATRRHRHLLTAQPSENRLRGIAAMAAREGKLYLAINATENWLGTAASAVDVSITHCLPAYRPPRAPRVPREIVPNERDDFLRLFRLKGDPPGYGFPSGEGLTWLESTRGPQRRQHILLAFDKPIPIGSCVFPVPQGVDYSVRLSALKPDAAFPPRVGVADQWIDFETHGELGWDVAVAPPNTRTRALLITFVRGGDDELADLLDTTSYEAELSGPDLLMAPARGAVDLFGAGEQSAWQGRLAGMRILRRRFENRFADARVRVNSGRMDANGVWHANRTEPLSREHPAIYLMEWDTEQPLRGLAIEEVDGSRVEIDVFTGPPGADIALEGDDHWEQVGVFVPRRRMDHPNFAGHNAHALYMDGTVDFGREVATRAVRLRVVSQWTTDTREGSCARDGLGLDPTRCRVFGVAPLAYLGGEPPVDEVLAQRIEIVDGKTGTIERDVPITRPTQMAVAPDGTFYAVADGQVVVLDLEHGRHRRFATTVERPGALACDRHGNLYVYDAAPQQRVIHVYAADGRFLRQIGEPGGYEAGPWNPKRLNSVSSIAVDSRDQLWVVDQSYWPKRISCWTAEGEWLRDHYGHTEYGGGGVLDPENKTRLFYGPLEFEINAETGASRLKNLTWVGSGAAGEVPVYVNDRLYLVTRPTGTYQQRCGIVYLYENGRSRRVAAMGLADAFAPLNRPEITSRLGAQTLGQLQFHWTDHNGDGEVQFDEVVFAPRRIRDLSSFDRELNIQAGATAFEVDRFLDNGAPVYRVVQTAAPEGIVYRRFDGGYHVLGGGQDAGYAPDGTRQWFYPNEGMSVGPDRSAGPFTPEQVLGQFYVVGHESTAKGDLGEFFVVNANLGAWNVWTADGMLASRIFRDLRDGKRRSWTMRENDRGMRLDDVTAGQEHFNGWFGRSRADGKYYVVAGHNHASIAEVRGLEDFRRAEGTFEVTPDDLAAIRDWQRALVGVRAREAARVLDVYTLSSADMGRRWEVLPEARMAPDPENPSREIVFQLGRDDTHLFARFVVRGAGPFRNTGQEWDWLFRSGAAVDLMIGLDPEADPQRGGPVAGDKRIVGALHNGQPVVVLYDAVVPGTPAASVWESVTPAGGRTAFDAVRILEGARLVHRETTGGYTVELTLPMAAIGLDPDRHRRVRFDWGILETDAEGSSVLQRSYWSNTATSTVADAPTEARLEPRLWGWALLQGRDRSRPEMRDALELQPVFDVDAFLDDI